MIKKLVDIVNKCDKDESKIEEYITFAEKEIGSEIALVYKKYYRYVLNNLFDENTINIEQERELLIKELEPEKEKLNRVRGMYCLGESYYNEGDLQKSEEYFSKVTEEAREDKDLELFYFWAQKNLSDLGKVDVLKIDKCEEYTDTLKLEIARSQFKNRKLGKENPADLLEAYYKDAMYTAKNAPNYRDTLDCAFKYFNNKKCYKKAYDLAMTAYKNNEDKIYLNEAANSICLKEKYSEEELKEAIDLLELLLKNFMFNQWSKLAKALYSVVNKEKKIELLELISNVLKSAKLNTKVFEHYKEVDALIVSIYNDLNKNKYKGLVFAKYEKIFLKYTLYTSYQNSNIAEMFDSYTKLEVLKSDDIEIESALKLIGDPNITNSEKLEELKACPFKNQYKELEITAQDVEKAKQSIKVNCEKYKGTNSYTHDKCNEALKDISSDIVELKNEFKENLDENVDVKNGNIKSILQVIADVSRLNKTLKETRVEYVEQFKKEESFFEDCIKEESYGDIKKIVNDSYDEIERGKYPSTKLLYKDFNEKINNKLYNYMNEKYKTLLLTVINKTLGSAILFMRSKDYLIDNDIDEVIRNNPNFEEELQVIYERRLDYHLVYDNMKSEMNKIVEELEYDKSTCSYIKQPKWYSNILGSLFEEESEKIEQGREHIFESWESVITNILDHLEKRNESLIPELVNAFSISGNEEDKTTNYNVELLDGYIENNISMNTKLIEMKVSEEKAKEKLIEEYNMIIKHINEIQHDVDKYENQIKRKVVYVEGKLYKIN